VILVAGRATVFQAPGTGLLIVAWASRVAGWLVDELV